MALAEAIAKFVNDGDTVYAAGFTHLIPLPRDMRSSDRAKKSYLARATPVI